jgi:hypothetical protein
MKMATIMLNDENKFFGHVTEMKIHQNEQIVSERYKHKNKTNLKINVCLRCEHTNVKQNCKNGYTFQIVPFCAHFLMVKSFETKIKCFFFDLRYK